MQVKYTVVWLDRYQANTLPQHIFAIKYDHVR